jgi:hypothetical protein
MKVRMLAEVSGNIRRYTIGDLVELPDDEAKRWIENGFCEAATEAVSPPVPTLPPPAPPVVEAAAHGAEEEQAAEPRARKR